MHAYFVSFATGKTLNSGVYKIDSPEIKSKNDIDKLTMAVLEQEHYRNEMVTIIYFQRLPGDDVVSATRPV